jgi:hypothetical protein
MACKPRALIFPNSCKRNKATHNGFILLKKLETKLGLRNSTFRYCAAQLLRLPRPR